MLVCLILEIKVLQCKLNGKQTKSIRLGQRYVITQMTTTMYRITKL